MKADSIAWYVARSSGITAWVLLSIDMFLGISTATRIAGRKTPSRWLLSVHRFTGGLAVTFVAVHIAGLMADHFVPFGWRQVLVPFASGFRPAAVAAGIVAMYLLAAVELTSLLMHRLPRRFWRAIHSTSFVLYLMASGHVFAAGTDARNRAMLTLGLVLAAGFVFFVVYRTLGPVQRRRRPAATMVGVATIADDRPRRRAEPAA
jgi:predicted ferric reductase